MAYLDLTDDEQLVLQVLTSLGQEKAQIGVDVWRIYRAAEPLTTREPYFHGYLLFTERIRHALRGLTDKGCVTGGHEWWKDPEWPGCLFTLNEDQYGRAVLLLSTPWLTPDLGPRSRPSLLTT